MSESNFSESLRSLVREYCQGHVEFADYRQRRKIILDELELEYNGVQESVVTYDKIDESPADETNEGTLLGKVLNLFKQDVDPD